MYVIIAYDDDGQACKVLREHTKLTWRNLDAATTDHWPIADPTFTTQEEADTFTDKQSKALTILNYIHACLTKDTQKQLKADQDFLEQTEQDGNPYLYDGMLFLQSGRLNWPWQCTYARKVRK